MHKANTAPRDGRTGKGDEVETAGARAFGSSPLAVAITEGEKHVVRYVNAAWLELIKPNKAGLGRPLIESLPEIAALDLTLLDRVYRTHQTEQIVDARYPHGQTERCLTLTAWPWSGAAADGDLLVIQITETTGEKYDRDRMDRLAGELRRVNERLVLSSVREQEISSDRAEQLAGAEAASRAKSTMISSISHELRTPLTALLGYVDLMTDGLAGPVTAKQTTMLGRMKLAALHLLQLVEQILTYSRTEAGQLKVDLEAVDVGELVKETTALIEPLLATTDLSFQMRLPPERLTIVTDPGLLRQILINLLTNAIKFTESGEIRLEISADGKELRCAVHDTGNGIAPKDMERIFVPFQRVEQERVVREEGTGLGLAVSRRLARLLGGDLTAESKLGVGSTFTLRCPLHTVNSSHR
jgi:signal transduction histidine kinase